MPAQASAATSFSGAIGFDCNARVGPAEARAYAKRGFRFCVRYVSRNESGRLFNASHGSPDLSATETQGILQSGLALMVVQHVAAPGWKPTAQLGRAYGANAATYAKSADYIEGANLWLDLEGIAAGVPHSAIIDYCNAWFSSVTDAGYVSGVYVGYNVWLTSDELFFDLSTKHYWRADGDITAVAHRGYQMFQNVKAAGASPELDRDVIKADAFGGLPIWMIGGANSGLIA